MTPNRARLALVILLVGSGLLAVATSAQRWWSACGLSGFDTTACLRVQDHAQDYLDPGASALWLLAAAVLLLPRLAARPTVASWVAAGLAAGSLLVPGGIWFWVLGWPVALAVALPGVRRRWLLVTLLSATTPLAQLVLVPLVTGYASYDTTPWSEAVLGLTILTAAAAVAMTPAGPGGPQHHDHHPAPRDTHGHDRVRRPRAAAHG